MDYKCISDGLWTMNGLVLDGSRFILELRFICPWFHVHMRINVVAGNSTWEVVFPLVLLLQLGFLRIGH